MASERVPPLLLQAGDVIHVWHRHDLPGGECLSRWEIDAVVIEDPAPVCGWVAVKWADGTRLSAGGRPAITGITLFRPGEEVLRIARPAPVGMITPPNRT